MHSVLASVHSTKALCQQSTVRLEYPRSSLRDMHTANAEAVDREWTRSALRPQIVPAKR